VLVATFNETTGWHGKTITFEDDHFILEGHGRVSPKNITKYDDKGQLVWASDGVRAWVRSRTYDELSERETTGPVRRIGGLPVWAAVLIVLGVVAIILGVVSANNRANWNKRLAEDDVSIGVATLNLGVALYADVNNTYPSPGNLSGALSGTGYMSSWPTNPYTRSPMTEGTGPGDYSYTVSADGQSYKLVGYGKNGQAVVTVP